MQIKVIYKLISLALIIGFISSSFGDKQATAVLKSSHQEYREIVNGNILNSDHHWGGFNQRFEIPIGFNYQFFDTTFSKVWLETSGRLVFDENHLYFADAFSAIGLQDKEFHEKNEKPSVISYKHLMEDGQKVLTIQYKEAGLKWDSDATLNFQIRLFEKERKFQLHMGNSGVSNFSQGFRYGPYFGIYQLSSLNPLNVKKRVGARGEHVFELFEESGERVDLFANSLSGLPPSGTVLTIYY